MERKELIYNIASISMFVLLPILIFGSLSKHEYIIVMILLSTVIFLTVKYRRIKWMLKKLKK